MAVPQLTEVVLTDRQTPTPASRTFIPRLIEAGVGTLATQTPVPIGENRLTVSTRRTPSGSYKSVVKMAIPVVQDSVLGGVSRPVVVRTAYASVEFTFDQTSTQQERDDLVGLVHDALASGKAVLHDSIVNLQGVY